MIEHDLVFTADIGNTRTKVALWRHADVESARDLSTVDPIFEFADSSNDFQKTREKLDNLKIGRETRVAWMVSSVNKEKTQTLNRVVLDERPNDVFHILALGDIPMSFEYDHPEKLGIDRAVAAYAGVRLLSEKRPFLVVDVGTAATIDYVDVKGGFRGGAILPGPRLTAEALQSKTASLPMLDDPENSDLENCSSGNCARGLTYPAVETQNAIRLGVVFTLIGAVAAFYWKTRLLVEREGGDPNCLAIFLAGGNALSTERNLRTCFDDLTSNLSISVPRPSIIVEPRLVLRGLLDLFWNVGAIDEKNC